MKLFMLLQLLIIFIRFYHGKGIALESSTGVREHKKWTTDMDF